MPRPSSRSLTKSKTNISIQTLIAVVGGVVVTAFAVANFTFEEQRVSSGSQSTCIDQCTYTYPCSQMSSPSDRQQCDYNLQECRNACVDTRRGNDVREVLMHDGVRANDNLGTYPSDEAIDIQLSHASYQNLWWKIISGALPSGLNLSPEGRITGTPHVTETQTFSIGLQATDRQNVNLNFNQISLTITAPSQPSSQGTSTNNSAKRVLIKTDSILNALIGERYVQDMEMETNIQTSDPHAFIWIVTNGNLPPGLSINPATGQISGYPSASGPYNFAVGVSYDEAKTGTFNQAISNYRMYQMTVSEGQPQQSTLRIQTQAVPEGRQEQSYAFHLEAEGGSQPYRWQTASDLPSGLTLSEDGTLKGVPHEAGTYAITVRVLSAQNSNNSRPAERTLNLTISPNQASLSILTGSLPEARQNVAWELGLVGGGGTGAYSWSLVSDPIPGMNFSRNGLLSGRPSISGARTIRVRLEDTVRHETTERDFVFNVLPEAAWNPPVQQTYVPMSFAQIGPYQDGKVNEYYFSRPFLLTGGAPPYRWTIGVGALPEGLTLGENGEVVGVPRKAGTYTFVAAATDRNGQTIQAVRNLRILDIQAYNQQHEVYSLPPSQSSFSDSGLPARLSTLQSLGIQVHDLIKLQDDGNLVTQYDSTVYYIGSDGRRHAFPNPYVYATWFSGYSRVRIVSSQTLNKIALGANVTYRPGIRLVKFTGTPQIYAVDTGRRLRQVATGVIAEALYGSNWNQSIDDIPDTFFTDYVMGETIKSPAQFQPISATQAARTPSDILP